jgi:hypothetical protein
VLDALASTSFPHKRVTAELIYKSCNQNTIELPDNLNMRSEVIDDEHLESSSSSSADFEEDSSSVFSAGKISLSNQVLERPVDVDSSNSS